MVYQLSFKAGGKYYFFTEVPYPKKWSPEANTLTIGPPHTQMNKAIDFILSMIETSSAKLHSWSWNKRWCNRDKGYGYKRKV